MPVNIWKWFLCEDDTLIFYKLYILIDLEEKTKGVTDANNIQ